MNIYKRSFSLKDLYEMFREVQHDTANTNRFDARFARSSFLNSA